MKYCNCCKTRKTHREFSKDAEKFDSLRTICKSCDKEASCQWYREVGKEQRDSSPNLDLANTAAA